MASMRASALRCLGSVVLDCFPLLNSLLSVEVIYFSCRLDMGPADRPVLGKVKARWHFASGWLDPQILGCDYDNSNPNIPRRAGFQTLLESVHGFVNLAGKPVLP